MLKRSIIPTLCAVALGAIGLTTTARADITFELGNNPQDDDDNVLFNDDTLSHEGTLVQGNFNGQGSGFIVDFTSSSGNGELIGNGGQARVEGAEGNTPIEQITFALEAGATFTSAVLNPFSGDGTATVTVTEDNGDVSEFVYDLGNGQNFLTIVAINGQKIASVSISAPDGFTDLRQVRIGGFEGAAGVPDGGLTLMLLGLSLPALAAVRRYLAA